MNYRTRQLVAIKDFPHGDRNLTKDETFTASEVDAEYYIKHGRAKDAAAVEQIADASAAVTKRHEPAADKAKELAAAVRPAARHASQAPEHARPPARRAGHAVEPMKAADVRPGADTPTAGATATGAAEDGKD
jgi:hypothetical protein